MHARAESPSPSAFIPLVFCFWKSKQNASTHQKVTKTITKQRHKWHFQSLFCGQSLGAAWGLLLPWQCTGGFRGLCRDVEGTLHFQSLCIPESHQTKWHRGCHRNPGQAKPVHFPLHSQGTTGDSDGLSPTPAQGSEPTASSSTSQHAPGLLWHNASASLSSRSRAPAPWITQAPVSYGNGHERKCLNRFSLPEHSPARCGCPGAGTRRAAGRCPEAPAGSRFGQCTGSPCAQPCCPPCPPKTMTICQPVAPSTPGAPYPVPCRWMGAAQASLQTTLRNEARNQPKADFTKSYNIWEARRGGTTGAFMPSTE